MFGNSRNARIFIHVVAWVAFLCLPVIFISGRNSSVTFQAIISSPYYWLFIVLYATLFYSHTYFVFPKWYLQKKFVLYGTYLLVFFCSVIVYKPFDRMLEVTRPVPGEFRPPDRGNNFELRHPFDPSRRPPIRGRELHFDLISVILFLLTFALSIAVVTSEQLKMTKERALKAETKKIEAELLFLKMQINPHFLFNTLNNIYSLALTKSDYTAEAVLKLSNILRYVIDEASKTFVSLKQELSCMQDYIDLQKMRLSSATAVVLKVSGDMETAHIAPMLLMTFVENAFKYGVSAHHPSEIFISVQTQGSTIEFTCSNKIFAPMAEGESTGIGIRNAKHRLTYLYGSDYQLDIDDSGEKFVINLVIDHKNKFGRSDA